MSVTLAINPERRKAYREQGFWGDASLGDYWQQSVRAVPDKIAVVDGHGASYTYAGLDRAAGRLASWLQEQKVQPGDRVAFQLPGWCEFTLIYLACLKIGAVSVPLLPAWREAELVWVLNKCQAKIFFAPTVFKQTRPVDLILPLQAQLPQLRQIVGVDKLAPATTTLALSQLLRDHAPLTGAAAVHADALAAVLFTSGTEGKPKGVMLTHNNILASERAYCARLNLSWQDVFLMPAPLGHATGFLHGVTAPFLIGARSVLLDIFTPEACLNLLEEQRCTLMSGATPFVYDLLEALVRRPTDLSSLRFFLCGGTTIPKKVARECRRLGVKLLSIYGSTESSPHALVNLDDPPSRMMNTDGYAAAGVEIRVVDEARTPLPAGVEGEEASRGPGVFVGYLDEPELTARALDADGWYYSGDICRMDEAGYITITGRKKDIIVRGGENISSREVEDILLLHPRIHDACVVAMPDERLGERSCAYVVPREPGSPLSLEEIVDFFSRRRVAKYKYPEHVVIVDKLPRTASGKVQKYLLRQDIIRRMRQSQSA
ncbi:medium-chain fatty-acid--CoA ligase [Intestinirhabdus alba]|jgi:acyl-CoA synthetase|uniref:Medium-chain fatty-acid--CoA ligase n=1 Tax=Intestinirhabdus alba TaxID=2899544 RepID=A0A6L6IJ68_9ENTR|nr:medium-chain fatty-acid--CoA ligase [Intestinirhabdus alba]MTH46902.1 medium-chain fatty-acid--CoA ligase [Intestinirhabdus alba]